MAAGRWVWLETARPPVWKGESRGATAAPGSGGRRQGASPDGGAFFVAAVFGGRPMRPLIELNDILLRRGAFRLHIDQLHLQPASLYALQGENGAGKSSLLQLLALCLIYNN